jgi:hypothetical protein
MQLFRKEVIISALVTTRAASGIVVIWYRTSTVAAGGFLLYTASSLVLAIRLSARAPCACLNSIVDPHVNSRTLSVSKFWSTGDPKIASLVPLQNMIEMLSSVAASMIGLMISSLGSGTINTF